MTESFTAGQKAHSSGVYKAVHSNNHIPPHYITVLAGDTFPD